RKEEEERNNKKQDQRPINGYAGPWLELPRQFAPPPPTGALNARRLKITSSGSGPEEFACGSSCVSSFFSRAVAFTPFRFIESLQLKSIRTDTQFITSSD